MSAAVNATMRGTADIVVLIDATGSMRPCIDAVRESIVDFIDGLQFAGAGGTPLVRDWRVRIVGYRDRIDCVQDWIEESPFTRSVDVLRTQLAELKAKGGGDEPESLLDEMFHLCCLPPADPSSPEGDYCWRPRSAAHRFVVVFTDATYHPAFAPLDGGGLGPSLGLDDLADRIHESGIWLQMFTPRFPCYESMAEIDRCKWHSIPLVLGIPEWMPAGAGSDLSNIGALALRRLVGDRAKFAEILRALGRSISQSASTEAV